MSHKISVIIPAYKASAYLDTCLSSVKATGEDLRIMVGIDNCEETVEAARSIKGVEFFRFMRNAGPYIIRNTLLKLTDSPYLAFFDADDIMSPDYFNEVLKGDFDIVRYRFHYFGNPKYFPKKPFYSIGTFFCKAEVFEKAGGFMPWRCEADTEFMRRTSGFFETNKIATPLFTRRYGEGSITSSRELGYKSELRKKYKSLIKPKYTESDLYVEPTVGEYERL